MKNCKKCGLLKDKYGICLPCKKIYDANRRKLPEIKERDKARWIAYKAKNLEKIRLKDSIYAYKNKEKIAKQRKQREKENRIKFGRPQPESFYSENMVKSRNRLTTEWRRKNLEKARILSAYCSAKRKAAKIRATPSWCIDFIIREAYQLAANRTKIFGFAWHVDHIVPLQNKIVCGLHAHTNIQVIPKLVNLKKGNSIWPNMPI